jgi:hypothetical protein
MEALDLIAILRRIGKMGREGTWDGPFQPESVDRRLSEEEKTLLEDAWEHMHQHPWHHMTHRFHDGDEKDRLELILATDACGHGWGYVCMQPDGTLLDIHSRHGSVGAAFGLPTYLEGNDINGRPHSIYFKEMHAMCQGLIDAMEYAKEAGKKLFIHLMVDNVATLAAWRNGYSSTEWGTAELRRVFARIDFSNHVIVAFGIPGLLNVADVPSRMKGKKLSNFSGAHREEWRRDFNNRKAKTLLVYQGQIEGRCSSRQSNVHNDFVRANLRQIEY